MREIDGRLQQKCAFCRTNMPTTKEERNELVMKRIEANDPVSMCYVGKVLYKAGVVSKDDFAAALRGHHAAITATKSPQREEAYEFIAGKKGN